MFVQSGQGIKRRTNGSPYMSISSNPNEKQLCQYALSS